MDGHLFADFLRDWAVERGVDHVIDDLADPSLTDRGHIRSLTIWSEGGLEGDLFFDSSGCRARAEQMFAAIRRHSDRPVDEMRSNYEYLKRLCEAEVPV